jgi:predicted DNA-binding transcriptional regulator AlpA
MRPHLKRPIQIGPEPGESAATLLNEVDAAAFLGISPRALQKWRVNGRGPPFLRLSTRCIRYSEAELLRWLDGRRCRNTAEYGARPQ